MRLFVAGLLCCAAAGNARGQDRAPELQYLNLAAIQAANTTSVPAASVRAVAASQPPQVQSVVLTGSDDSINWEIKQYEDKGYAVVAKAFDYSGVSGNANLAVELTKLPAGQKPSVHVECVGGGDYESRLQQLHDQGRAAETVFFTKNIWTGVNAVIRYSEGKAQNPSALPVEHVLPEGVGGINDQIQALEAQGNEVTFKSATLSALDGITIVVEATPLPAGQKASLHLEYLRGDYEYNSRVSSLQARGSKVETVFLKTSGMDGLHVVIQYSTPVKP